MNANFGIKSVFQSYPQKIATFQPHPGDFKNMYCKTTAKRTIDGPNKKQWSKSQLS